MMANVVNERERHRRKREAWDRSQRNDEGKIRRIWKGEKKGIFGLEVGGGKQLTRGEGAFWEEDSLEGDRGETCRGQLGKVLMDLVRVGAL
jgi:hypothetical protein